MLKSRRWPASRRWFLQSLAATGLLPVVGCDRSKPTATTAAPAVETPKAETVQAVSKTPQFGVAALPKAKGPRVVVVGGGVSGLTMAKHLKQAYPAFDVVLVERRAAYMACYGTALWYAGQIGMETIAGLSYYDAARNGGYLYFQASCIGLDRASRTLATDQGEIAYDYLVLAPGVDYAYEKIGVSDAETQFLLQQNFPAGFVSPAEYTALKRKLNRFQKGVFVQTVPEGNYRCFASPFERACVLAAMIKREKRPAKVLLLDASPEIRIKKNGFEAAFKDLYQGIIEYVPSVAITGVDPISKEIKTDFDSYRFDDASIYPPVRGARLLERLDLVDNTSLQKEARIDKLTNQVLGDERVYVTGDSRSMPFSKSANTAHTEARHVAKFIAAYAQDKPLAWESPTTRCYSVVNLDPPQGISVETQYRFNITSEAFEFDHSMADENRDTAKAQAITQWIQTLHQDIFGV